MNFSVLFPPLCARAVQKYFCFSVSSVESGPKLLPCAYGSYTEALNPGTNSQCFPQSEVLQQYVKLICYITSSTSTSLLTFTSAWDLGVTLVTISCGQFSLSASHFGPFYHKSSPCTRPHRLPRSAGFSWLVA